MAVTLNDYSLRYSPVNDWALSQLTVHIPVGSCCAILGPTSAGKSTLLQTIAGLLGKHHRLAEARGSLQIAGYEPATLPRETLFPSVGLVLQDPFIMISGMLETVESEVSFTLQNLGFPADTISGKVSTILSELHLDKIAQRHPFHLSGGEVQRVALASVLVAEPNILLLDEPRNALDSQGQDTLALILRNLHRKTTVLFTDYQIDLALATADYILVLDKGRCLFFGEKLQFLKRFEEFAAILFTNAWKEALPLLSRPTQDTMRTAQRIQKVLGLNDAQT